MLGREVGFQIKGMGLAVQLKEQKILLPRLKRKTIGENHQISGCSGLNPRLEPLWQGFLAFFTFRY